ncbi:C4-dicarboxylate ABC transporter [Lysobacter sp. K5869]|uniref:SLAC1 family transporter n=1 Tax=Lysobacter sp. K5869 TaxID=2820808 RepID=UPI001C06455F|nr:C4-dicarboxylate ABC transporter [Lysobacter sp. K5869]QWP78999.1 C4-dicarboxylate ABC transporter [Lysobacter sp. K5869]
MAVAAQTGDAAGRGGVLSYLPVSLFGSVMGLTGLAVGWRMAHAQYGAPAWIGDAVGALALAAFAALAVAYAIKAATGFAHVRAEFAHPVAGPLFGTPLIALLLLPLLLAQAHLALARLLWSVGAAGMLAFAWWTALRWISVRQTPAQATPAWIVPVVGLLDLPLALPALGWSGELHGLALFATAVGLFFALPLFTLVLSRLMFEEPLPAALQPALLILVAPFAVGFAAYTATTGRVDDFAAALLLPAPFLLAVLLGRLRHLPACCPFRVSWWAAGFPLAASADAALKYAQSVRHPAADALAWGLLGLASAAVAALAARTVWGIARGRLRALSA